MLVERFFLRIETTYQSENIGSIVPSLVGIISSQAFFRSLLNVIPSSFIRDWIRRGEGFADR